MQKYSEIRIMAGNIGVRICDLCDRCQYTTEPFIFAIPTIRLCEKVQKRESEAKTYQLDVVCHMYW